MLNGAPCFPSRGGGFAIQTRHSQGVCRLRGEGLEEAAGGLRLGGTGGAGSTAYCAGFSARRTVTRYTDTRLDYIVCCVLRHGAMCAAGWVKVYPLPVAH